MKKLLLTLSLLVAAIGYSWAQQADSTVTIGTKLAYGKMMEISLDLNVPTETILVDWGDGTPMQTTLKGWSAKYIEEPVKGDTVIIYAGLKQLDVKNDSVFTLSFLNQDKLNLLDASNNLLTNEGLDLSGATNLAYITLSHNNITSLNLIPFTKLEGFYIDNNPEFNTAVFADGNTNLRNIDMQNCDIVHFYPISLPNLSTLNIANGSLMDIDLNGYPKLSTLDLSGNEFLGEVDVTMLPELAQLTLKNTGISTINLAQNPKLELLNLAHTGISSLFLNNNKAVNRLNVQNTNLKKLDVSAQSSLQDIYIDSTQIARLDIADKYYLRNVSARNTQIEWLDLHGAIGANRVKLIDVRDNKNMTPQTINYMFETLPWHSGKSWGKSLLIAGSNGETSNPDLVPYDESNYYKLDVEGDGTASMDSVDISASTVNGGTYTLNQVGQYGADDSWHRIYTKAKPGYPISIVATPAEGYTYVGVKVNGKTYEDTVFVTSVAATIEPIFESASATPVIKLTVQSGAPQQYFLRSNADQATIQVDWGDGEWKEYNLRHSGSTTVAKDDGALGSIITIKGDVGYAEFESFPAYGIDNKISAIDLSGNPNLYHLSTYMAENLKTLDVSNQPNLTYLDCSYNGISSLDLSHNTKLITLRAYGNADMESINLSKNTELEYLDVKNCALTELDITKNPLISSLIVANNDIEELEVGHLQFLENLNASNLFLSEIDVTNNTHLKALLLSNNMLEDLDLSENTKLEALYVDGNRLTKGLDLSHNTALNMVNISSNGMDACTLNDLYYLLPQYKAPAEDDGSTKIRLWVQGNTTSSKQTNDAEHAEGLIAQLKGWVLNIEGDGSGCPQAYVHILPTENGTIKITNKSDNSEVTDGTKVAKGTVLTVEATPATGYKLKEIKANGQSVTPTAVTINSYTELLAIFEKISAVTEINVDSIPEDAIIYSIDGHVLSKAQARNGIYIVNGKKVVIR